MTYQEAEQLVFNQLPFFQRDGSKALKLGLNNIIELCSFLGNPQHKFRSIHVGGTNGKGSTSHFLASIFQESGKKTALYTSPHLKDFRERFKINGKKIPKKVVVEFAELIKNQIVIINPTFFEVTVALAFYWFAKEEVEIAIIEVGLGGRLDSTNVITPELSIITNISYDHQAILGDTLAEIAFEKAGIIKESVPVIIGEYNEQTFPVFETKAKETISELIPAYEIELISTFNSSEFLELTLKTKTETYQLKSQLKGFYQVANCKTVLAAFENFSRAYNLSTNDLINGLKNVIKNTGLKGRWQVLNQNPFIVCDTGHNEAAWEILNSQLKLLNSVHYHFILGFSNDKKITKIIENLPKPNTVYFTSFNSQRSMTLKEFEANGFKAFNNIIYKDVNEALKFVKKTIKSTDVIFIGGSTFVVAELNEI